MIADLATKRISNITVTKIYRRFSYKMAAKNGGHSMKQNYVTVTLCITRISATADGPRDALSFRILSAVETSCTTKQMASGPNGVRELQLTHL